MIESDGSHLYFFTFLILFLRAYKFTLDYIYNYYISILFLTIPLTFLHRYILKL